MPLLASSSLPSSSLLLLLLHLLCLLLPPFPLLRAQLTPPRFSVFVDHLDVGLHEDLVVGTAQPRFSWRLIDSEESDRRRGVVQRAYQLQLRSLHDRPSSPSLRWDSGRVPSNRSLHVPYTGPALSSDRSYEWRLRHWTAQGEASDWAIGRFRTGLLNPAAEFTGQWIGHSALLMNELRKEFALPSASIVRATAFVACAGYYELYVNGQRVDPTRRLDPGYTLYEKDLLYVSYDVTALLSTPNAAAAVVGVRLGDGWYSQQQNPPAFGSAHSTYGPARLLFQLNLQTDDGQVSAVVSDDSWMGREGMVSMSSPFMGESYSARKERTGWSSPGFRDPHCLWLNAAILPSPLNNASSPVGGLRLQSFDPIRAGDAALHMATSGARTGVHGSQPGVQGGNLLAGGTLQPIATYQPTVGWYVFDLGQNFAGTCRTTFSGVPAGVAVSLQHAEVLRQPGVNGVDYHMPDPSALRGAVSTDVYITRGVDGESYSPSFTVHGFRYFSVYGLYDRAQIANVTCDFVHSEATLKGNFSSSSPVINQLQHNVQWGQLSNLMSVPTDCPQRDERRGWTGDASLSVDETLFNFDLAPFYESWLTQFELEQGVDGSINDIVPDDGGTRPADPNWGSAFMSIVVALYDHYGDLDSVRRHFPHLRAWVDCLQGQYNQTRLKGYYFHYGDWVPPTPYPMTDPHLTSAYAFLRDTHRLVGLAQLLNYTEVAAQYAALYAQLAAEFHSTWYRPAIQGYADGLQAANIMALSLPGVVPANLAQAVLGSLVSDLQSKGHFTTGIVSIARLFPLLSSSGQHDLALRLIQNTTYPSYGFQFSNSWENATTVWETWDAPFRGDGPYMNSRNHHMYASIGAWFYRYLAGIHVNAFAPILIHPRMAMDPTLLSSVHAEVVTVAGPVRVDYERHQLHAVSIAVTVPHNTHAQLTLDPLLPSGRCVRLTEGVGQQRKAVFVSHRATLLTEVEGVEMVREKEDRSVEVSLLSGSYNFHAQWADDGDLRAE